MHLGPYIYRPETRLPCAARFAVGFGALLIWEWPDGDWCWLDQLWRWEWRHKQGGRIETFI